MNLSGLFVDPGSSPSQQLVRRRHRAGHRRGRRTGEDLHPLALDDLGGELAVGGGELLGALLDLSPEGREIEPPILEQTMATLLERGYRADGTVVRDRYVDRGPMPR